jgi:hypothetical protein
MCHDKHDAARSDHITIDFFNRQIGSVLSFEVDESVALRCASLVLSNLAAQDVAESRECVVHSFVVDGLVQVLDEDIPDPRFAERWVALGPHDADGTALDEVEVHCVENALGWKWRERKRNAKNQ